MRAVVIAATAILAAPIGFRNNNIIYITDNERTSTQMALDVAVIHLSAKVVATSILIV